jgi:hypothetical protein
MDMPRYSYCETIVANELSLQVVKGDPLLSL